MPQLQGPDFQSPQICLARALYDNVAEAPDELSFSQGDVLTVLEQNTNALEGWWLCALRGRQGIVPGNRLRLLAGMYDGSCDANTLQRQGKRRSWHVQPNKVLTPQKFGDVYLYDMPPNQSYAGQEQYDVPPATHLAAVDDLHNDNFSTRHSETYSRPNSCSSASDSYDMPRPLIAPNLHQQHLNNQSTVRDDSYDIPQPSNSTSFQTTQYPYSSSCSVSSTVSSMNDSFSISNSNKSSSIPDYDVPRGRSVGVQQQLHQLIAEQNYDVPSAPAQFRELPLELNSALERLAKLEAKTTSPISELLCIAGPQWREREKLEPKLRDVKRFVLSLQTSLHDLTEFGEGALGNAMTNFDNNLANKLLPMVRALKNADFIIQNACSDLVSHDWSIDKLAEDNVTSVSSKTRRSGFDALDKIVNCAKELTEDVRQIASFIQGNSSLLFNKGENSVIGDYDYVNLDKNHLKETASTLPFELQKSLSSLRVESMVGSNSDETLVRECPNSDRQLLSFYAAQAETRTSLLTHAIDAFLQTVEHNQPPKVFLAYGKFVIVSAHCLVHIGDTVHHNLTDPVLKSKILNSADSLCKRLAATVQKTKRAAMQFPSVSAVQEMVNSIVDVSHLARDLKMCLVIGAQQ